MLWAVEVNAEQAVLNSVDHPPGVTAKAGLNLSFKKKINEFIFDRIHHVGMNPQGPSCPTPGSTQGCRNPNPMSERGVPSLPFPDIQPEPFLAVDK